MDGKQKRNKNFSKEEVMVLVSEILPQGRVLSSVLYPRLIEEEEGDGWQAKKKRKL